MDWFWKKKEPVAVATSNLRTLNPFSNLIGSISYDGETTPGQIGVPKDYRADHTTLRTRGWQSYFENEITQTILNKYVLWMVGGGLKLESEPNKTVLESFGENVDPKQTKQIENLFKVWADSNLPDFAGELNLNQIAEETFKNKGIAGDILIVLRIENNLPTVQMIDAAHVETPFELFNEERIRDGVELNSKGGIKGFHVRNNKDGFDFIKAKDSAGRKRAFLIKGSKYRLDDTRGMPIMSPSLETLSLIDRYKSATVGSAEERQKMPYVIEHTKDSTGENPLAASIAGTIGGTNSVESSFDLSGTIAENVKTTQNKEVINLPVGATMKPIDSKNELYFKEFFDTNFQYICSAISIPPDVARSVYDSSYSASRAAIKDWEHVIKVGRKAFTTEFYKPIYTLWLDVMVLSGAIDLEGYSKALQSNNVMLLEAYRACRFVGANVPHIDPLKEVKAEREKLGELGKNVPLTTVKASMERLDGGDVDNTSEVFNNEVKDYQDKPETNRTEED